MYETDMFNSKSQISLYIFVKSIIKGLSILVCVSVRAFVLNKRDKGKKSNAGGITISNFKIYYSHSNKNSMVLEQKQTLDQWNRIEDPEVSPNRYCHLILNKNLF
jgi:hypothetical protein